MRAFKIEVSDWIRPENIDVWHQRLFVQTGADERTLGVDLGITGYELKKLGINHPSQMPRKAALEAVKRMAYTLADHIELTIQEELRGKQK